MGVVKFNIVSRSGKSLYRLELDDEMTVGDLKKKIHSSNGTRSSKPIHPVRQRLTIPAPAGAPHGKDGRPAAGTVLSDDRKRLKDLHFLSDSSSSEFTIQIKDLGPQVGYAMVFFWEYFGPLVVYPLFFFFPQFLYPASTFKHASSWKVGKPHHDAQKLALLFWSFHYAKRIYETFAIHSFGHATMPLANLFRNCLYYWGFAAWVSYSVNHPLYTSPYDGEYANYLELLGLRVPLYVVLAISSAVMAECSNYKCHVILSKLRAPGDKGYKIPSGFLFDRVTCANYTCELISWVFFSLAVSSFPAVVFTVVGGLQMAQWAIQKHRRLTKLFDGKDGRPLYPKRNIMIPFIF